MSKKSRNQKKVVQAEKIDESQTKTKKLTSEEAAAIIRNRLANRPVIIWRYRNGKLNKRFIITLAIMIVALIAALYFISRTYYPS